MFFFSFLLLFFFLFFFCFSSYSLFSILHLLSYSRV
nr:MAG TPA: hypothetical protein [Crassvirales sp.]